MLHGQMGSLRTPHGFEWGTALLRHRSAIERHLVACNWVYLVNERRSRIA